MNQFSWFAMAWHAVTRVLKPNFGKAFMATYSIVMTIHTTERPVGHPDTDILNTNKCSVHQCGISNVMYGLKNLSLTCSHKRQVI